jgi:IclR family transcriptional regulator, acetate operon repressor
VSSVKEIQSVRNACRVLEAVAQAEPVGVSELARTIGIDKSAAHRLAITLHAAGWLDRRRDGRWAIAPTMSAIVAGAARRSLVHDVRPLLERARDETGETAMVVVAEGTTLRIVAVAESQQMLRVTATPGVEMPARNSSALRALAAHLGPVELDAWRRIDPGLTEDMLDHVRTRGWSVNDAELIPESRGVAAALLARDGSPIAAFVVCGPSTRFRHADAEGHGALVASIAGSWNARAQLRHGRVGVPGE